MTADKMTEELAGWYIRRAYHNYRQAQNLFNLYNDVESIVSSFETIEFSIKALCKLLDVNFTREHSVDAETLSILAEKVQSKGFGEKDVILQVIPIVLACTEQLRNILRYGIEKPNGPTVSPPNVFRRAYAASILDDAKVLRNLLGSIEMRRRWKPKIKLAILNGYVAESAEKKCSIYPFTNNNPNFWKDKFQTLSNIPENKFEIKEIKTAEISEEFAIVLNPFGEAYAEIDLKNKSIFHLVKNYLEDGGVYINTAGFPFFYAWNVKEGKEYPISEERVLLPRVIQVEGQKVTAKDAQMFIQFTGTLLYKEFNAIPAPVSKPRTLFQEQDDKTKFGDLVTGLNEIKEFRGLPKGTADCIPIIRAKDEVTGEVYPVSALKRGNGYLLLAGMDTSSDVEANLFVKAVDGFCNWITSLF